VACQRVVSDVDEIVTKPWRDEALPRATFRAVVSKDEMKRLRSELGAARVFEHREGSGWLKFALILGVLLLCVTGAVRLGGWAWPLLVPVAAAATTIGTLMGHEASHGSFSSRRVSNRLLSYLSLSLLSGMSWLYWKHKHDGLHHGHPNVVAKDPDVEIWPMAMSRAEYEQATPLQRWFQRNLQAYTFWPATLAMAITMRTPSYLYLIGRLRAGGSGRMAWFDAACLVGHYTLWVLVPALVWGPLPALAFYVSLWGLVGVILAAIFAPAHMGLPLMVDQHVGWRHQFETTRNFRAPRWLSFLYVGLDYQIEHHIFPLIPHQNLPRASAIVRRWCAEQGLPYHEIGVVDGLKNVTAFLQDAWQIDASSTRQGVGRSSTAPFARDLPYVADVTSASETSPTRLSSPELA
jgi:fatty acid desaturase